MGSCLRYRKDTDTCEDGILSRMRKSIENYSSRNRHQEQNAIQKSAMVQWLEQLTFLF